MMTGSVKIWKVAMVVVGLLAGCITTAPVSGATFLTTHQFVSGGLLPVAPLLRGPAGILYGTTSTGGAYTGGTVFKMTPSSPTTYSYSDIYNFCPAAGCVDGSAPVAGLIMDTSGNLYGTTQFGGANAGGTVFELVKPVGGGGWTRVTLYSFCSVIGNFSVCLDGKAPLTKLSYAGAAGGAFYDGTSLLYGVTNRGGDDSSSSDDLGVVFALQKSGGTWSEKVLHTFLGSTGDGSEPDSALIVDSSNVIWGTTKQAGSGAAGVAFTMTPGADFWNDPWSESIIYNFCWNVAAKCPDGRGPNGIIVDAAGNIFGAANAGGGVGPNPLGNGVVFELTNTGCPELHGVIFWCSTVLYNFCPGGVCGNDGWGPPGALTSRWTALEIFSE